MKKVILDTSFIVTCVKQKIDFFEELLGTQILIPKQVIKELKGLDSSNSRLALAILKKNKFHEIDLGKGKVDNLLINYSQDNKDVIVATLDREIKKQIKGQKMVIRGKKKLEII
jgi:rRNA-processing protein FCF1